MNEAFALHRAIDNNNLEIVTWLLGNGVDVNLYKDGITPAIQCITNDRVDIFKVLILHPKLDINKTDQESKNTVLHFGAYNNSIQCMTLLLGSSQHPLHLDAKNIQTHTPLMMASFHGYIEIVKLLLAKGAGVMIVDSQGNTALHAAMKMQHWKLAAELIKHKANYNFKNLAGLSPYMLASPEMKQKIDGNVFRMFFFFFHISFFRMDFLQNSFYFEHQICEKQF